MTEWFFGEHKETGLGTVTTDKDRAQELFDPLHLVEKTELDKLREKLALATQQIEACLTYDPLIDKYKLKDQHKRMKDALAKIRGEKMNEEREKVEDKFQWFQPCPHGIKHFTWCPECKKDHCVHWNKKGECHIC